MKFYEILFVVGVLCVLNALGLWWCCSISGWMICKVLVVIGVNCLVLALMMLE